METKTTYRIAVMQACHEEPNDTKWVRVSEEERRWKVLIDMIDEKLPLSAIRKYAQDIKNELSQSNDSKPSSLSRVTVVNKQKGRVFEGYDLSNVELSVQDNGRTLKVFYDSKPSNIIRLPTNMCYHAPDEYHKDCPGCKEYNEPASKTPHHYVKRIKMVKDKVRKVQK